MTICVEAAVGLLRRMSLLRFQAGFLRRPGRFRGPALPRNAQPASDQIGESLLCQLAIPALAAHVACDHPYAAITCESRGQFRAKTIPLLVIQHARAEDIPEYLDPRRRLVDVLTTRTRRSGNTNVELAAWNRQRFVDRERVLWDDRRRVAHGISASGKASARRRTRPGPTPGSRAFVVTPTRRMRLRACWRARHRSRP